MHNNLTKIEKEARPTLARLSPTNYSTFLGLGHYSVLQNPIFIKRISHIIDQYAQRTINPNHPICTNLGNIETSSEKFFPLEFEIEADKPLNPLFSS